MAAVQGAIEPRSVLTCPRCGHRAVEVMPTDACQFFYDCTGCGAVLRPEPGDCCVFCSFGSVPCPPVQAARSAGRDPGCGPAGAGSAQLSAGGDPER